MGIIIPLIVLLVFRINRIYDKQDKKVVISALAIFFSISIVALIFLQQELAIHSTLEGTIGTDAYRYWLVYKSGLDSNMNIIEFMKYLFGIGEGEISLFLAFYYVALKTFPIVTPILIKFINILLSLNIIVLLYYYLEITEKNINLKSKKIILYLLAFNGGIILTSIRLFKDILLLYILLENIYNLLMLFEVKDKRRYKYLIRYVILAIINNFMRDKSLIIYIFLIIFYFIVVKFIIEHKKYNIKRLATIGVLVIILVTCIGLQLKGVRNFLNITQQTTLNDTENNYNSLINSESEILNSDNTIKRAIVGTTRTLLLPTPFKTAILPINYDESFFEGITSRVLEVEWQIIYIFIFSAFIYYCFVKLKSEDYKHMPLILFSIIQIITYSLMYFGGIQVRWKLPLIILFTIFFGKFINDKNKKDEKIYKLIIGIYLGVVILWAIIHLLR